MIRIYLVGNGREYESVIPLKYDNFYNSSFKKTYIIYGPLRNNFDLLELYKEYGINTSSFEVIPELELTKNFKDIYYLSPIKLKSQGNHTSISMQMVKFLALDYFDEDKMVIQDADAFLCKPYSPFTGNMPNTIVHKERYANKHKTTIELTRITPQLGYISEIFPITKTCWLKVKEVVGSDFYHKVLESLKRNKRDNEFIGATIFSEYELMGCVMSYCKMNNHIEANPYGIENINTTNNLAKYLTGHMIYSVTNRLELNLALENIKNELQN